MIEQLSGFAAGGGTFYNLCQGRRSDVFALMPRQGAENRIQDQRSVSLLHPGVLASDKRKVSLQHYAALCCVRLHNHVLDYEPADEAENPACCDGANDQKRDDNIRHFAICSFWQASNKSGAVQVGPVECIANKSDNSGQTEPKAKCVQTGLTAPKLRCTAKDPGFGGFFSCSFNICTSLGHKRVEILPSPFTFVVNGCAQLFDGMGRRRRGCHRFFNLYSTVSDQLLNLISSQIEQSLRTIPQGASRSFMRNVRLKPGESSDHTRIAKEASNGILRQRIKVISVASDQLPNSLEKSRPNSPSITLSKPNNDVGLGESQNRQRRVDDLTICTRVGCRNATAKCLAENILDHGNRLTIQIIIVGKNRVRDQAWPQGDLIACDFSGLCPPVAGENFRIGSEDRRKVRVRFDFILRHVIPPSEPYWQVDCRAMVDRASS